MNSALRKELFHTWAIEGGESQQALAGSGKAGAYDAQGVDCPFVFEHNDQFYMMHIGFDGNGYQTALAVSDDLLNWQHEAMILPRLEHSNRWDHVGAAGSWILLESNNVWEVPKLRKLDGRYWMIYHSYPDEGYEAGGAIMGLAWTTDESLKEWHRLDQPIFTYEHGAEWEKAGLYKCCLIEHEEEFWMFYNAKGDGNWPWKEETGLARSTDLMQWKRHDANPIMGCRPDSFYSLFNSDPCIRYDGQRWLNFGFGFDGVHAQGLLATSEDLLHWDVITQPLLPHGGKGDIDEIHAHKSFVVVHEGNYYHYYCACRPARPGDPTVVEVFEKQEEFRCIAVSVKPINDQMRRFET